MMDKRKVLVALGILAVIGLGYYGFKLYQTSSGSAEKNARRTKVKRERITDDTTEEEI
jgi:FtsZ-interacting cell division protein ZipA